MTFSHRKFFLSIFFIATIGVVATDIYLPSFPALTKVFSTTKTYVQMSFSLYLLSFSLSQLIYGPFSEKHGRKKAVLWGLFLSLPGTLISLFAWNVQVLIVGRILQGLGLGMGPPLFRAILRDAFSGNMLARASSMISIATACLMALAPTIGGYIQSYLGWRYSFVFMCLYTLLGIMIVWACLPETLKESNIHATKPRVMGGHFKELLFSPIFISYALCGSFAFTGLTAFLSVSPFIFQDLIGLTPIQYGWLALLIAAGLATGGVLNTVLVKKMGRHKMLEIGVLLMILGAVLMFVLSFFMLNTWAVLIPMVVNIAGVGVMIGNSNAGALEHFSKIAGFAGALFGLFQFLGSSLGTMIMAYLKEESQRPLSIFLVVLALGCFIFQKIGYSSHMKLEKG